MANKNEVAVKTNVGDSVIARINSMCEVGFSCPPDYNFVNAIKASMLVLQDLKDKNGKPALEVATQGSIATALFDMAVRGLDASKKTCYFIMRGDKLCLHESYFGKVLQVKRIYPNFDPHPVVIRQGDEFLYEIDPKTGCKRIVKHTQSLENLDRDFVGAYMYLPTADGGQDLYIMSRRMILTAWSKSSSKEQTTAKQFDEKMVTKTLIHSACNMIINSTPDLAYASNNEEDKEEKVNNAKQLTDHVDDWQEAEEVQDAPQADVAKEEPKEEEETDF